MIFIHGGTFRHGGCDSISYNRTYLAKENRLILVGINYRLGDFGFSINLNKKPANLGLLDVIEGLKRVKNNMKNFYGDNQNITILVMRTFYWTVFKFFHSLTFILFSINHFKYLFNLSMKSKHVVSVQS